MIKLENTLALEEELENIREKLNKDIIKYMDHTSEEGYGSLIDISRKLDDVIVNYIKSSNNKSKIKY